MEKKNPVFSSLWHVQAVIFGKEVITNNTFLLSKLVPWTAGAARIWQMFLQKLAAAIYFHSYYKQLMKVGGRLEKSNI